MTQLHRPRRRNFALRAIVLGGVILGSLCAGTLSAQVVAPPFEGKGLPRRTPSDSYYMCLRNLYDGDYHLASRGFQAEARGSIKTTESRWIDSICYETMLGECFYQTGHFKEALDHYTTALMLFERFSDWMTKLQFDSASMRPATPNARNIVPWGTSTRPSQLGVYATSVKLLQGQIDQTAALQHGGVIQQANLFPVTPQEIVRCTTLAMRRRATLLGPTSKFDPLTNKLVAAVNRPIGQPNHWSECWTNLERGLALAAAGQESPAISLIEKSVLAGGQFDHPMTCVALFELGRNALEHGDFQKASLYFEEATYSAANYSDFGVLEEAFRYGAMTHLLANRKGLYPPLESAIGWAKVKNLRQIRASLLLSAAENYAILGETRQSGAMLDEARATIGRRKMELSWLDARLHYLSALVYYQQKKLKEGNDALAAAMDYMRHGSLRLFHIELVDQMYVGGLVTQRAAVDLFSNVLRDPQPADWTVDPQEWLAVLTTPHPIAFEHWFGAAFQIENTNKNKDVKDALEITDRAKRHRFFSTLALGGRLESLRWLLESPIESLPQQSKVLRQDLLARYPAYAQLSQQGQAIRGKLAELPLAPDDQAVQHEQGRMLKELGEISVQQETALREIAVRREPAEMLFPPMRRVADLQKALPEKHAVLAFFATSRQLYGFLMNNDRVAGWEISSSSNLTKQMTAMFRDLGQLQSNRELPIKDLTDEKWKQSCGKTLDTLLNGSPADFSHPFDELAIVPDGVLWYLPFEALQVTIDGKPHSLISRFRIRYAPTVSLTTSEGPGRRQGGKTAVVVGRLYPHDQDTVAQTAFEQIAKNIPGAVAIQPRLPSSSALYKTLLQGLIVLDDLNIPDQNPYGWSPIPSERGKQGNTLADWFTLPWGGPDVVILPGYHTAAEDGLKRLNLGRTPSGKEKSSKAKADDKNVNLFGEKIPGNDVFLSLCGLMANGARTVVLSRWRMGGQTSFDLVREFTQELPNLPPADAWQRAVALTVDNRLDLDAEPRIKRGSADEPPKATHPSFWAGYMLIDCGTKPEKTEPAEAQAR